MVSFFLLILLVIVVIFQHILIYIYSFFSFSFFIIIDVKEHIMKEVEQTFFKAGVLPGGPHHTLVKKIIPILLRDGQIDFWDFAEIVNDDTTTESMLQKNVFALHPIHGVITFQSRAVEFFVHNEDMFR